MKSKLFIPIGMLFLASYFILKRYSDCSDFTVGLILGISIGLNLIGVIFMSKRFGKKSQS